MLARNIFNSFLELTSIRPLYETHGTFPINSCIQYIRAVSQFFKAQQLEINFFFYLNLHRTQHITFDTAVILIIIKTRFLQK